MADPAAPTGGPAAGGPGPARPPRWRRALTTLADGWLLLALLVVWEVWARADPSLFFPPLTKVLGEFGSVYLTSDPSTLFLSAGFWDNAGVSLARFLQGWLGAIVVGVAAGLALGRSRVLSRMYDPIVRFFMSMPKVALLPVAVQIFGVTDAMNVFLIFLGTVWIILVNTADGIAGVDESWVRSGRSLRLSRFALFTRVLLPAAAPRILAGIRVSVGTALILMIVSELYATTSGLGYQIVYAERTFAYLEMWAGLVLVALIGIALNGAMSAVERRLLRWERRTGLADL
ncbi:ABC transporter permease [Pseudonocardia pini]|uniref:ABC transporter permease n=1 Tax=Pseudonocardia pini TaxID=2758030 RepID=UPI0015F12159|nr:ABC transporter permease [Pseudonocardia pini]